MFQYNKDAKELYEIYDKVKKHETAWRLVTSGEIVKKEILNSCSEKDMGHFSFLTKEMFITLRNQLPNGSLIPFKERKENKINYEF